MDVEVIRKEVEATEIGKVLDRYTRCLHVVMTEPASEHPLIKALHTYVLSGNSDDLENVLSESEHSTEEEKGGGNTVLR